MKPSNYLKIKNKIPSNVNILAVSKGFKSQEIITIQNMGQNDFGESKFQEAFEKQSILKNLKQIKWHFIGRIQSNKIRKIVQNFKYIADSLQLPDCSMGMSGDWQEAIDAGSTWLRLGSLIFGDRT